MKMINVRHEGRKQSNAHYSSAAVHRDIVFVSGQLPMDPYRGISVEESTEVQTQVALQNLLDVLKAAGSSKEKVLQTTAHIRCVSVW